MIHLMLHDTGGESFICPSDMFSDFCYKNAFTDADLRSGKTYSFWSFLALESIDHFVNKCFHSLVNTANFFCGFPKYLIWNFDNYWGRCSSHQGSLGNFSISAMKLIVIYYLDGFYTSFCHIVSDFS